MSDVEPVQGQESTNGDDGGQSTPDAGVPEGTVLETKDGSDVVKEKVVNDTDETGKVVGWHKEAAE